MFKIGDTVIVKNTEGIGAKIGATGKIYGIDNYLRIAWFRNGLDRGQANGGYCESTFDLLFETNPIYNFLLKKYDKLI